LIKVGMAAYLCGPLSALGRLRSFSSRYGKREFWRRWPSAASPSSPQAGEGIPPAERERVFLPFYRLRGDRKGAGLGLALVRQIARLHGGDARVMPRPDAASAIVIGLAPAVLCASSPQAGEGQSKRAAAGGQAREAAGGQPRQNSLLP